MSSENSGDKFPSLKTRESLLRSATCHLAVDLNLDYERVARMSAGLSESDFTRLVNGAAGYALFRRSKETDQPLSEVTTDDFLEALKRLQYVVTNNGFSTKPDVTWDDVWGLDHIRQQLYEHVIRPFKSPEECKGSESSLKTSFLLYGPPGVGKKSVALAVANEACEAGLSFIHVKSPELLERSVGETVKAMKELFRRARMASPCIVFFDQVHALRSSTEDHWVAEPPLHQLMVKLSGGKHPDVVIVIAATYRPDLMDPVVQRAGKFGLQLYVKLPDAAQRFEILHSLLRNTPVLVDPTVDLNAIAVRTENRTGADLKGLVNRAAFEAFEACKDTTSTSKPIIKMDHFEQSLSGLGLTNQQMRECVEVCEKFDEAAN